MAKKDKNKHSVEGEEESVIDVGPPPTTLIEETEMMPEELNSEAGSDGATAEVQFDATDAGPVPEALLIEIEEPGDGEKDEVLETENGGGLQDAIDGGGPPTSLGDEVEPNEPS